MCHQATTYQAAADAAAAGDRRCCVLFDISITRPARRVWTADWPLTDSDPQLLAPLTRADCMSVNSRRECHNSQRARGCLSLSTNGALPPWPILVEGAFSKIQYSNLW